MIYYKQRQLNETKMTTPEMLDYIKRQQQAGKSREEIAQALKNSGWQEADIQEGLGATASTGLETNAKLPPALEMLKTAWSIYQERFWLLLGITAVPAGLMIILGLLAGGGIVLAGVTKANPFASLGAGLILLIVAVIAFIYIGVWSSVAELFAIKDHQENIGFQEAFKRARPYINPFFVTSLLAGLAIMGGFILFIVPGIIFMLWFSQSMFVVINENLTNTKALGKSKAYVKGRLWEVFLKYLLIGIIVYGTIAIASLLDAGIARSAGKSLENFSLLSNVFSFALAPLLTIYSYIVYRSLRGEKV